MKFDARLKIIYILLFSTLIVIFNEITLLLFVLALSLFFCFVLKVDFKSTLTKLKPLIILIISLSIIQSLFSKNGNALLQIKSVVLITDTGLLKSAKFFLRMVNLLLFSLIITTSNSKEVIDGFILFKIPYPVAFMVLISIRFIPIIRRSFINRQLAIKLRGINKNNLGLRKRVKLFVYLLSPVVANTILKSIEIANSLETRAFMINKKRTMFRLYKLKINDYICLGFILVFFASIIILRLNGVFI